MNKIINLDTAATTLPDPQVLIDYIKFSEMYPFNPSAIYAGGVQARAALEEARSKIAEHIGCDPDEIFFTSGGTEGNNMVLHGFFEKLNHGVLITTQVEHPSILRVAEKLEKGGLTVYYLPVDHSGLIDIADLENTIVAEIKDGVPSHNILVSIQYANNEIGTVQNVTDISIVCAQNNVFFHSDIVQGFPHEPIDCNKCDSFTVSGHKFKALRGTGFVYINKKIHKHFSPLLLGGHQEMGMRSGTENVAGFIAMANMVDTMYKKWASLSFYDLYEYTYKAMKELFNTFDLNDIQYRVNGIHKVPIYSITIPGVDADSIISLLSDDSIYISAGSACRSYEKEPSHVLKAIGLSDEDASCTLRICINPDVDYKDWLYFVRKLVFYVQMLKGGCIKCAIGERKESGD